MIKASFSYDEKGEPTMELIGNGQDEALAVKVRRLFVEYGLPTTEHNFNIIMEELKAKND